MVEKRAKNVGSLVLAATGGEHVPYRERSHSLVLGTTRSSARWRSPLRARKSRPDCSGRLESFAKMIALVRLSR
ncbi:MAG: hypothetical protein NTV51_10715, partial [Verrucomicrobia bacterium]|nr:hypothetical protein [Verrucomicrobiota bacterium]